jgi:hypothetical protein
MLILPESHQLVRLSILFDRNNDITKQHNETTMIMDEPMKGVWLPKRYYAYGKSEAPHWSIEYSYSRDFYDYAKSEVTAKFWFEDVTTKIWNETDKPQPKK